MAPFDRPYSSFCWSAVINIAIVPFSSYLALNNVVDLKSGFTQGHWKWHHSKAWYGFLFAFHTSYGSFLYRYEDRAKYWSNIVIFYTPLLSIPPLGGFRRNSHYHTVWYGKLEWCATRRWKKTLINMFSRFDTIYRRTTDGRTSFHSIVRAMHTHRAVKTAENADFDQ